MGFRVALRTIRQRPSWFVVVVCALALAIGITTALFAVLDGLLFRPLPFRDPGRLVVVDYAPDGKRLPELAYLPELADRRRGLRDALIGSPLVSAWSDVHPSVMFDSVLAQQDGLDIHGVDSRFFPLFGLTPFRGRTFTIDDERMSDASLDSFRQPLPIIIGYDLWRRAFGGDPQIIGGVRELAGRDVRIVGVMNRHVKFPGETDVWVARSYRGEWPPTYVRLVPDASLTQVSALFSDLRFRTLREVMRPGEAGAVPVLFGAAVLLLMVAWVQVTSITVSATLDQFREIGVRRSLGASRSHLLRQFAAQGALTAGTALGLAWMMVWPLTGFIVGWLPEGLNRGQYLNPDLRTMFFGCLVTLLGFALFTVVPLSATIHATPLDLLQGRIVRLPVRAGRVRRVLVVAQMTVTTLLMYVTGLAAHSFVRAVTFDYGFDTERVVVFTPPPPTRTTGLERPRSAAGGEAGLDVLLQFRQKVQASVDRLENVPGVVAAANFFSGPLSFASRRGTVRVQLLGGVPIRKTIEARGNAVGTDFVQVLGATLVAGHTFSEPAYSGRRDLIVINETLARHLSPPVTVMGQEVAPTVIGSRLQTVDGTGEVIGIVKDFVDTSLDVPSVPQFFRFDRQAGSTIVMKVTPSPEGVLPAVRGALEPIWGVLPMRHFTMLRNELDPLLMPYRGQAILLTLIVACCLPIAAVGLAGAMTHSVRLRTHEIAIRLAVGADPNTLQRTVTRQALVIVSVGVLLGTGLGMATGRIIAHHLFQVRPVDLTTLIAVMIGLMAVGCAAAFVPARHASRVDPAIVLRNG